MKIVGKRGLSGAIEIALAVLMGVALVLTVTLPWSIPAVTDRQPGEAGGWFEKYLEIGRASCRERV